MGGLIGLVVAGSISAGVGAIRRLVLNDVGPAVEWRSIERISAYLGKAGQFASLQEAADAMWAVSTSFGPHTPEEWMALSRHMVKPVSEGSSAMTLHYDPAIAIPLRAATPESTRQAEAILWKLYDNIQAQTLILRGADSDLLSHATALAMTQRGPRARLVEFEGVGHAPTLVAEDQVTTIGDFLFV